MPFEQNVRGKGLMGWGVVVFIKPAKTIDELPHHNHIDF
jgi:hypothetical protein